jgi:hypothetical protein
MPCLTACQNVSDMPWLCVQAGRGAAAGGADSGFCHCRCSSEQCGAEHGGEEMRGEAQGRWRVRRRTACVVVTGE